MQTDIAIARAASLRPIAEVAAGLGVPEPALQPYGRHIAKLDHGFIQGLRDRPDGRLVLVTAISPTPAGEGKTTTTVGLGDGLARLGREVAICLREPSMGPCFGAKGGAAGGGYAQVVPMEQINLHFTGDFHAIGSANNLLAALLDNHVYWGNGQDIDTRRIVWRRVLDMNDRALRAIVSSLGGAANGYPREGGFDITVASEVMAVFCLARDVADLEARLGRMVVAYTRERKPVTAADLKAAGAMTVLLKDALMPNLVQTLEGTPAFVHGGPFANIAHGCNSVLATTTALKLARIVVTEAGFGADLGAEKFFDIKCRKAGLRPAAAVVVATVRALKMHGGVDKGELGREDLAALERGMANLARHVENLGTFGVPVVVAVNRFATDTEAELDAVLAHCRERLGVDAHVCEHWARGGAGIQPLAESVAALCDRPDAGDSFAPLYPDSMPLWEKVRTIATRIYRAGEVTAERRVRQQIDDYEAMGLRPPADLRRQDPVQLRHRPHRPWRARGPRHRRARGAPVRRCRVRRRHLRRDHDHARPAAHAGGRGHQAGRCRPGRRAVLAVRARGSARGPAVGDRTMPMVSGCPAASSGTRPAPRRPLRRPCRRPSGAIEQEDGARPRNGAAGLFPAFGRIAAGRARNDQTRSVTGLLDPRSIGLHPASCAEEARPPARRLTLGRTAGQGPGRTGSAGIGGPEAPRRGPRPAAPRRPGSRPPGASSPPTPGPGAAVPPRHPTLEGDSSPHPRPECRPCRSISGSPSSSPRPCSW